MSTFDPALFLDATMDAPLIKRPPIPAGEYTGIIGEMSVREGVAKDDPTKAWKSIDVKITLDLPYDVQQAVGLDSSTLQVRDSFFLDLTPGGGLDNGPGKNGGLRRYREATDLNKPGDKFAMRMLEGRTVRVKVGHREYPQGSGDFFEDVKGVAKL